ncbi:MAG: thiamine phosphate synthase [Bacteroidales bacterium]|nr:thiamine phosphate synthase [Bacteroidales bacterium]
MKHLQFITHANERYNYVEGALLALKGGCKWIQLRMKDATHKELEQNIQILKPLCLQHGATLIVDDCVEIARRTAINGVHLGKNDMDPAEARTILGNSFIIGGTANTFEDIVRLHEKGVNYIGLGPFRFTTTKSNLSPILGMEGYKDILMRCSETGIQLPIVAIGGITKEDIPELMTCGIAGIAMSSAILSANDPIKETKEIMNSINLSVI